MIKTENLTKKFEDYKALDTINCTIPEGWKQSLEPLCLSLVPTEPVNRHS